MHYTRWRRTGDPGESTPRIVRGDDDARFWAKVVFDWATGCYVWTSNKDKDGYGIFWGGAGGVRAHRWAYERFVGPIPDGYEIDHFVCNNPSCVNWAHLVPVTGAENRARSNCCSAVNARKTHCNRGHEYTEENIYRAPGKPDVRDCRACRAELAYAREARRRERRRATA